MDEFEPQKPTLRVARRALMAAGAMVAMAVVWKFAVADRTPPPAPLDPAAAAALQHAAFTQAEVQPGFVHAENVQVKVLSGETLESAVERAGVARADAQHAV